MVATIAFGMGIDKPDVRFVCHADLPGSHRSLLSGNRPGRPRRSALADTLTLYGEADVVPAPAPDCAKARPAPEPQGASKCRKPLEALIALCETPRCRRQTLLAAFGEIGTACGFCDMCDGAHAMFDGKVAAQKAMSAVLRTAGRFYPGHLANLLIGNATDAISRHGHDDLPTFGVGGEFTAAEWRSVFRQIQAAGLIVQDEEEGRWMVTDAGRAVLKGEAELDLVAAEPATRKGRAARAALAGVARGGDAAPRGEVPVSGGDEPALTTDDARLFAKLKAWRTEVARTQKVPPYVVFNDRTLRAIASARPRDAVDLGRLHGIGPAKIASYGEAVLAVLGRFAEEG